MRLRFSIARLLAVTVIFGVAFAALKSPSYLWANALWTAALASLVVAAIHMALDRGRTRAFWCGFLIAGGTYLATCSLPVIKEAMCVRLLTEPLMDLLYPQVAPPGPQPSYTAT